MNHGEALTMRWQLVITLVVLGMAAWGSPVKAVSDCDDSDTFAMLLGTVWASYTCQPSSGTVPFQTSMAVTLANTDAAATRRLAGRIDVFLAGGSSFSNWRSGYTNVAPGGSYVTSWNQSIPAVGGVIGANVFRLTAQDVTPSPYNQPPYLPAGDTDTDACTITAQAP
jgi:hypothetical protein